MRKAIIINQQSNFADFSAYINNAARVCVCVRSDTLGVDMCVWERV